MAKYINPFTDVGFKRIFGQELSKPLLLDFLNSLFGKAFVSIENLATFSSLPKGIDPETLNWNYPASRTVSFGINLTL